MFPKFGYWLYHDHDFSSNLHKLSFIEKKNYWQYEFIYYFCKKRHFEVMWCDFIIFLHHSPYFSEKLHSLSFNLKKMYIYMLKPHWDNNFWKKSPPYWIRHFEFGNSDLGFVLSDPKNPQIPNLVKIRQLLNRWRTKRCFLYKKRYLWGYVRIFSYTFCVFQ